MDEIIEQILKNLDREKNILLGQNEKHSYYCTLEDIKKGILENIDFQRIVSLCTTNGNQWKMLQKNALFTEKEFYPVVYNIMKEKHKTNCFTINQNIYRYILRLISDIYPQRILDELKDRLDLVYDDLANGDSFGVKTIFSNHGIKVISSSINSFHLIEQSNSEKDSIVYKISFMGIFYFVEINKDMLALKTCTFSETSEILYLPIAVRFNLEQILLA